jgi:hypothetical protein
MKKLLFLSLFLFCSFNLNAMDKITEEDKYILLHNCQVIMDAPYQAPEIFLPSNGPEVVNNSINNIKKIFNKYSIKYTIDTDNPYQSLKKLKNNLQGIEYNDNH